MTDTAIDQLTDEAERLQAEAEQKAEAAQRHRRASNDARMAAEYKKALATNQTLGKLMERSSALSDRLNGYLNAEKPPHMEEVWQTYLELRTLSRQIEGISRMVRDYRHRTEGIRKNEIGVDMPLSALSDDWRQSRWSQVLDQFVESRVDNVAGRAVSEAQMAIMDAGTAAEDAYARSIADDPKEEQS